MFSLYMDDLLFCIAAVKKGKTSLSGVSGCGAVVLLHLLNSYKALDSSPVPKIEINKTNFNAY